jgi:lipopolysaccharide O-acetyltransferase
MDPEAERGYSPQDIVIKDVIIGEGVWLGQRVCVLPGVTIGAHSIIGAGGIVTRDIPPYSIAVGIPAKVIKIWNFERKCWEAV